MNYLLLLAASTALIAVVSAGEALECWACSYEAEKKECKGEDIDTSKIPKIKDPDGDTCYMCLKISYDGDKKGARTCVTKKAYKDTYKPLGIKKNKCKKDLTHDDSGEVFDDATYCLCDENLCNGSGNVQFSILSLVLVAIAKFLW